MKNRIKILPAIVFALVLSLRLALTANAATVEILNIDPNASATYSGFVHTVDPSDPNLFNLTRTFDFDGGGANDTLSFSLERTLYGDATSISTGGDVTVGPGAPSNAGNANNWYSNFDSRESIRFDVSNIMYTSGETDGTTAVFSGFQFIGRTNISGDNATMDYLIHTGPVGSTTFTSVDNAGLDLTSAGNSSTVFITAQDGNTGIRLRDLDLRFETVSAVPEPSSAALLLGGIGVLVMRRRRRLKAGA